MSKAVISLFLSFVSHSSHVAAFRHLTLSETFLWVSMYQALNSLSESLE